MPRRWSRWLLSTLAGALLASIAVDAQRPPSVADLLQAADTYLVQYSHRLSAVTAEEAYVQFDTSAEKMRTRRRLSADAVFYGFPDGSVAAFRDVFAIDSVPVRAREDRLTALLRHADPSSSLDQARRLTDDSVHHYLSQNLHALDQPTIALEFLRKANHERSTFTLERVKTTRDGRIAVLKFTERSTPRLVPLAGGGGAVGRFWIDVTSGTVRQTEIGISSEGVSVRATVKYEPHATLNLWLPVEMFQQIASGGSGNSTFSAMGGGPGYRMREAYEGRATYSNFRQVAADQR